MTKPLPASSSNPALRNLRDTARVLRKPQAVVARNWLNTPAMVKYRPSAGITRQQFDQYLLIARRLAAVAP
jgi:hypothetical protein